MKNRDKILDYFDNVADGTVVSANDMYEHGFERMKQEAFSGQLKDLLMKVR